MAGGTVESFSTVAASARGSSLRASASAAALAGLKSSVCSGLASAYLALAQHWMRQERRTKALQHLNQGIHLFASQSHPLASK